MLTDRLTGALVDPLRAVFEPRRIALVGASDRPGSAGKLFADNLSGFPGEVIPVGRSAGAVASLRDIGGPVDLAVVVVPAAWYLIRLFQGVMTGARQAEGHIASLVRKGQFRDIQPGEFIVVLPLLLLIVVIGFVPNSLTSVMEPSVVNTLQHTFHIVGSALIR